MAIESAYVAPSNQLEKDVVAIWEKFLDHHPIGVKDDFFELGGHSLMALRIIAEIEIELGIPVPLAAFAQARSIDNLTRYLREQGLWSHLIALQSKGTRYPFFCVPPSVSTGMIFEDLAKNLGEDQPFYGLNYSGMDGDSEPHTSIEEMAKQNIEEIQTLQPEGPYFLGGMCFGGLVAYEMAQQFLALGQEIAFLGILDSTFAPKQRRTADTNIFIMVNFLNDKLFQGKIPIGPRYLRRRIKKLGTNPALEKQLLNIFSAHTYARMKYTSPPYPKKITLFSTERQIAQKAREMWQKAATADIEIMSIPGGHGRRQQGESRTGFSFIKEPNVQALAQKLSDSLEDAFSSIIATEKP